MEFRLPATVVIEADSMAEAAATAAPLLEDVNTYLGDDYEVELTQGELVPAGEG